MAQWEETEAGLRADLKTSEKMKRQQLDIVEVKVQGKINMRDRARVPVQNWHVVNTH